MAQYIDKDTLIGEIEKLRKNAWESFQKGNSNENQYYLRYGVILDILSFLNTLEVKEVGIEDVKSVFEGQYLSKDKVVITIERLQDECEEKGDNNGVELLEKLFNKLDTLEVKEVDLEKQIQALWSLNHKSADSLFIPMNYNRLYGIAKHFFELGLKTQKGE